MCLLVASEEEIAWCTHWGSNRHPASRSKTGAQRITTAPPSAHTHTHLAPRLGRGTTAFPQRPQMGASACSVTLFTDSNFDPDPGRANNTSGPGAAMSLKVNRVPGDL